jgi:hypothetical protein
MKKTILSLFFLLTLAFSALDVKADPPGPPGPGGNPGGTGGVPVGSPIDGGVTALLALGLAYGGAKLLQKNKLNQNDNNV